MRFHNTQPFMITSNGPDIARILLKRRSNLRSSFICDNIVYISICQFVDNICMTAHLYTSMFLSIFTKENSFCDFLDTFLEDEALPKWCQVLTERICSKREEILPFNSWSPFRWEAYMNVEELLPQKIHDTGRGQVLFLLIVKCDIFSHLICRPYFSTWYIV